MDYRREIDGLRALAVIPVILFHAGFQVFRGGFVGVDVFFVISGYLITSIIIAEKQAGTFTLVGFYERRARRILPALFVVMLVCLPFAWMWMDPFGLKQLAKSFIATATFSSNILFFLESGYFDVASELKPLIHTWSLAVEEQYYLLFPIFVLLTWKLGKRWIFLILGLLAVISMLGAHWGSLNYAYKAFTFFLLPTRGWEILIGSLVALYLYGKSTLEVAIQPINEVMGALGLVLIIYAVCIFDKQTPYPSLYTLMPIIGTSLVILFGTRLTKVGRLLGSKYLVSVGLISYSAYLWHQPVFVGARYVTIDGLSKYNFASLTVIAFALAYCSWRFVEKPFRDKERINRNQLFVSVLICSIASIVIGMVGYFGGGFRNRFEHAELQILEPEKTNQADCGFSNIESDRNIAVCFFGDTTSKSTYALYGDSHAGALFSALDAEFKRQKLRGIRIFVRDCLPVPDIVEENATFVMERVSKNCKASFLRLIYYLDNNVDGVIVSIRWTLQMYPIQGVIDERFFDNGEGGIEREADGPKNMVFVDSVGFVDDGTEKIKAVGALLHLLDSLQKPVFVIYPVPEVGVDVPRILFLKSARDGSSRLPSISTSYRRFKERNRFVNNVLDSVVGRHFIRIKPETLFCDTYVKDRCVATIDRTSLYYDDDHLSNAGARLVVEEVMNRFKESPSTHQTSGKTASPR